MPPIHVLVRVHDAPNENREEVEVDDLGAGRYRVRCPPRFAYGLAAGDEFELRDGVPIVTRHSGNLTVWFFCENGEDPRRLADLGRTSIEQLGAVIEGTPPRMMIVTVPLTAGWKAIEKAMQAAADAIPGTTWSFANVYEPGDGTTPLNWWKTSGHG